METYTIAEAAELTGASPKAIRNRVDRGQLRAVKRDAVRRIPRSELIRAGLLPDDGQRPPELPTSAGAEPAEAEAPTTRPSVVGNLLERLERQAVELGELRTLTSRADTERSERDELTALIRETREAALRADARAAIVERHLSRIPSDFNGQPALPRPRGEEGDEGSASEEGTPPPRRRLATRLALAGSAGLMLLAVVVATMSVATLRSVGEADAGSDVRAAAPGALAPVSVLAYPRIGEAASGRVVAPAAFAEQIRSLDEAGYETIGASELSAVRPNPAALPRRPLVLTFDDPSSAEAADRSLAQAGFRGLLVPAGPLDAAAWERMRTLARTGRWDFGARAPSAASTVTIGRDGAKGPFLESRRWLFRERRLETADEYAARVAADLDAAVDALVSRGFRRPRVFAFPVSPETGQRVPPELRRAIFRRFRIALVDVEPARTSLLGATQYLPRIQAASAGSPSELVTTVATTATRARRSPSSAEDRRLGRRVLQGWSTALAAGDFRSAARFFAPGAVVERSAEVLLTSPRAAVDYNRSFPCRARLEESRQLGASTLAAFRLAGTAGRCAERGRLRILAVIRGGKFEEWRQLD